MTALAALLAAQGCAAPEAGTCPAPDPALLAGTPAALQRRFSTVEFWGQLIAHGSDRQLSAMIAYADRPGFDTHPGNLRRAGVAPTWRAAAGCPDVPDSPRL